MTAPLGDPLVINQQVEILTPPPAVWNVFRDLEAWPSWNPVCPEAAWEDGASWHAGSTFRLVIRLGDELTSVNGRILEDDIPWAFSWTFDLPSGIVVTRKFELDWQGKKTIQIDTTTVEGGGDPSATQRAIADLTTLTQAWLQALKVEVERAGVAAIWDLTSRRR
ncbi:MAG: SRPBCC family protein [Chloroflexi bacterium]|nr:SRPBCC family protein [Chloroflexota bacterium]